MLNHSADVRDVIGSVRKAFFDGHELVFEAGISSKATAQDILTLIEEGHLDNAFSITMIDFDYDYEGSIIKGAEVIEVSVVYRGSNREARLLSVKSVEGETEVTDDKSEEAIVEAPIEATEPVVEKDAEPNEAEAEVTAVEEEEAPKEEEVEEAESEKTEEEEETSEDNKSNEEKTEMDKEIAKDAVVEKAVIAPAIESNYLESKKALADFRKVVLSHHRGSNQEIMKEWTDSLKSKAIAGDAIFPARIESIFFKAWTDNNELISTFRQSTLRAGALYAMVGKTNGKAKGHTKGADKVNQEVEAIRRDVKALAIYKKLPIDLQDLFDDETGELLAFRVEELSARVANAIVVGAIIGDGEEYLNNGRGLFPMVADIETTEGYGNEVAQMVSLANADKDNGVKVYQAIRKALINVDGTDKVVAISRDTYENLMTATTDNGALLFPVGLDLSDILKTRVFILDELEAAGYKAIAFKNQSYVLFGESSATVRTDFDLTKNQDVMLVERYVGGSLDGYHVCAGVKVTA
ncbi:hypothetical protein [Sharpea azabuensis]